MRVQEGAQAASHTLLQRVNAQARPGTLAQQPLKRWRSSRQQHKQQHAQAPHVACHNHIALRFSAQHACGVTGMAFRSSRAYM